MVTTRVLIFGGNGQIGQALQNHPLPPDWQVGIYTHEQCDFLQPGAIGNAMRAFGPDLVINAAALTDIDLCEQEPDKAREINFHAVANIAGQCATLDAPLIHLSTDYVFDGTEGRLYEPDDAMNPLNVYGQMKLLGEEAARHGTYWHVILRTSLVFSAFGNNVLTKTLHQLATQDEARAVADQFASPTSAMAVAEGIITIATAILNGKGNGFGTFHLCGEPAVTRFEFLQAIMEAYAPFTDRRPKLIPVLAADLKDRVPRPAYTPLNCDKTRDAYGILPRAWRDDLTIAVKQYIETRT